MEGGEGLILVWMEIFLRRTKRNCRICCVSLGYEIISICLDLNLCSIFLFLLGRWKKDNYYFVSGRANYILCVTNYKVALWCQDNPTLIQHCFILVKMCLNLCYITCMVGGIFNMLLSSCWVSCILAVEGDDGVAYSYLEVQD